MPPHRPAATDTTPTTCSDWPVWKWLAFAALCVFPIFFSLGNHPIHGDSEARYGVVARGMAEGEASWLVPHYFDRPHLTKPPLTYWFMAASMRVLGDGEWALRLPAALAGTATLAVVFGFTRRRYGLNAAVTATAILSVTPMFVVLSRLATTDSFLGLFCTAAMASGILAVRERRQRWAVVFWVATALALLTKGPAGFLPAAALLLWLAWKRPPGGWSALQPWLGLPAAAIPVLAWAGLIASRHPEVWEIWRYETFDRAVGAGDHPEPWWFFGPVGLVGLLPGSAVLVGWLIVRLRNRVRATRGEAAHHSQTATANSDPTAMNQDHLRQDAPFWVLVIVLIFAVFTLIAGKLMSYLLPLAAPIVWLVLCVLYFKKWNYKNYLSRLTPKIRPPYLWFTALIIIAALALAEDHLYSHHPPAA
ncbi:MAG: glycosyltransferase family 39 protein, partial [Planctomycetota bacterium]